MFQVTFFSFPVDKKFEYLPSYTEKKNELYQRTDEFHQWVIQLAVDDPNLSVIIKTKYGSSRDAVNKSLELILNSLK